MFLSSHLLSELSLIADHVVIIGRGEIIADSPISALTGPDDDRVRVRTKDVRKLNTRLAAPDVTITSCEQDVIEVEGLSTEQIARAGQEVGALVTELTPQRQTLEEAYNQLTRDAVEFASA